MLFHSAVETRSGTNACSRLLAKRERISWIMGTRSRIALAKTTRVTNITIHNFFVYNQPLTPGVTNRWIRWSEIQSIKLINWYRLVSANRWPIDSHTKNFHRLISIGKYFHDRCSKWNWAAKRRKLAVSRLVCRRFVRVSLFAALRLTFTWV